MAYGENIFTGLIDENGTIWDMATGRKQHPIGIDRQKEQDYLKTISEMQDTLDNWKDILIKNGLLKVPKSAEEIAQERAEQQAEINHALLQAIQSLQTEIGELRNVGNGRNGIDDGHGQHKEISTMGKKTGVGSKKSIGDMPEVTPTNKQ